MIYQVHFIRVRAGLATQRYSLAGHFCTAVSAPRQERWTNIWLSTIAEKRSGKHDVQYEPAVFSRVVTTRSCPGKKQTELITTWIEPLAHGLRHPHALCQHSLTTLTPHTQ
jgi:hypothetical protein